MSKNDSTLTAEQLRGLVTYDPVTGEFHWLESKFSGNNNCAPARKAGALAGCINHWGYQRISINYVGYQAHRLAWLYVFGAWPKRHLDHINGVKSDNRICNLRECNDAQNGQNRRPSTTIHGRSKSSKFMGVSAYRGMWRAVIVINKRQKFLGAYATEPEAHQAYLLAKSQLHQFNPVQRVTCE